MSFSLQYKQALDSGAVRTAAPCCISHATPISACHRCACLIPDVPALVMVTVSLQCCPCSTMHSNHAFFVTPLPCSKTRLLATGPACPQCGTADRTGPIGLWRHKRQQIVTVAGWLKHCNRDYQTSKGHAHWTCRARNQRFVKAPDATKRHKALSSTPL